jgi:hypothetical protein
MRNVLRVMPNIPESYEPTLAFTVALEITSKESRKLFNGRKLSIDPRLFNPIHWTEEGDAIT